MASRHLIISDIKWKYLMRSIAKGKNIMLTGPTGCGKTMTAQEGAKKFPDRQFFYFNLGATQDPRSTLIGNTHYDPARGTFVAEALFVNAIQTEGAIILLDELSRAHPDAWNILMAVLDENQRYLRIDEHPETPTIRVAPQVTFIATANIGNEYTSTKVLDRAIVDRFPVTIEMPYLTGAEELSLLTKLYPGFEKNRDMKAICDIASFTRTNIMSDSPSVYTAISTRATVEMGELVQDGFSLGDIAEVSIYPLFSPSGGVDSERTFMRQFVQKYL